MKNKIVLMTGATSGLGKVAACEIANNGSTVYVFCRDDTKGVFLKKYYKDNYPNGQGSIVLIPCNLSSFKSVSDACKILRSL
jgi:short-subunit dehydrogenase